MTKHGASRLEWNLRGGNTWGDMKVLPLNDLCERWDFGNGSHPIFSVKEIELVGVLPLVNLIPENPKLKKMKKRVIESKWKWKKQIRVRPIIWNKKKREKRTKQRIKNSIFYKRENNFYNTKCTYLTHLIALSSRPSVNIFVCFLVWEKWFGNEQSLIERIGEDLRVEAEEVKKKRERGYHAFGIFVILGKSLRVRGFDPSYIVISIKNVFF